MAAHDSSSIRNVAVVGHRGSGKTSLVEALLFQSGATTRLGTIEQGTTVSDWDEDEHRRQMSLSASLAHVEWRGTKANLVDAPGDSGFQADTLAALRVVEGAIVVVNGVNGVEVQTGRIWRRCEDAGVARLVFVSMLDRERSDYFSALEQVRTQLSDRCVAVQIPIGAEHELAGVVDLLHMRAYLSPAGGKEGAPVEMPADVADQAASLREQLVDAVVETDEALMERYLEGEEIGGDELSRALEGAVLRGELFPVTCGVATWNLGTTALLDLLVEGVPSPGEKAPLVEADGPAAFVFKTVADPFAGRITVFRVVTGPIRGDSTVTNHRTHGKERLGQVLLLQGKESKPVEELASGDIGAVAKLKETTTGDLLLASDKPVELQPIAYPQPVMSFAITPKAKGDEEKATQALRRLHEEDPTLVLRRDEQTGEQLLAGMSQMHVEVAVERVKRRFGVEVELHQPRVPYLETIRSESRARHRYKKQTGGRGQFGDCDIVLEPIEGHEGYEFVDQIVGGVIPQGFRPAVDKGVQEAMRAGELAGAPVQGVRVRLVDGQYHNVDSSEMAFKIAGGMAFKDAYAKADPVLLEPIMALEVTVPDETVGAVNGDLNSRRGRLLGMDPVGGTTTIHVEVPMAEVLTYSQSLTSLTGGRGDYTMGFVRYEEVPAHIAQKVIEETRKQREEAGEGVIVRKVETATTCRVCGRTLLLGERAIRFAPAEGEWVEVCALCTDEAYRSGWVREGSPTTPLVQEGRRRKRRLHPLGFLERRPEPVPAVDEPFLRRVSEGEQAMLDAAEVFNESPYRRTVAGIAKSLGDPHVSFVELSGTNLEVVLTVAWDLSWYQYRVSLGPTDSVRLAERGYEVDDLDERFRQWNGSLDANGRAAPDIPRI